MESLSSHEMTIFLCTIGGMLLLARFLSVVGECIHIPTLIAEILAGIILGPTIFGYFFPDVHSIFFPEGGHLSNAYETLFSLSVIMLLFLAGLDLDFSLLTKAKKVIIWTSIVGILVPFCFGFLFARQFPAFLHASELSVAPYAFPLIFATIISISSLSIIARILISYKLTRAQEGIVILGTALVTDVVGWFSFTSVMVYADPLVENINILLTLFYVIAYLAFAFYISGKRRLIEKILVTGKHQDGSQSYDVAMLIGICLLSGAFTNSIHIHPGFGAFIAGIFAKRVIGDNEEIFNQLHLFIMNFFAPIFFISIGLKIDLTNNTNIPMFLAVFVLVCTCKFIGGAVGAYIGGFNLKQSAAVATGLNARGSMEIIMSAIALKAGIIYSQLFVTFILLAVMSNVFVEPLLVRLLKRKEA